MRTTDATEKGRIGGMRSREDAAGIAGERDIVQEVLFSAESSVVPHSPPPDATELPSSPLFSEVPGLKKLRIRVAGLPVPQGNAKLRGRPGGKAWLSTKSPALVDWRQAIRTEAQAAMNAAGHEVFTKPRWAIEVGIVFQFPRSKSKPKYITHNTVYPDIDKLSRAILDGLTGVVYQDDSQVYELHARKAYGETEFGAWVNLRAIPQLKKGEKVR